MVTKKDLSIAVTECLAEQGMTEEQIAASFCCGELDSFDESFWADFGGLAVLTACGLEVGGNVCDIEFVVDGTHCLCGLQFGSCLDVEGANKAIARYSRHLLSQVLSAENEVYSERDELMLTHSIDCTDFEQLQDGLKNFFRLLNDHKDTLAKLCVHFASSNA